MEKQQLTLHQKEHQRSTNLQIIRFLAAMLVILCHAYPLCLGQDYQDMLGQLTDGCVTFGGFAVAVFFFVSGFYAIQSMRRAESGEAFIKKKLKKMIPPLIFVVVLCALVIGPLVSEKTLSEYFTNMQTYRYLLNGIFILQHNLPGVFAHNIYGMVVNGALWTMPLELVCLIACTFFVIFKLDNQRCYLIVLLILMIGFAGVNIVFGNGSFIMSVLLPCMMFYIGVGFALFDKSIRLDVRYFVLILLLGSIAFCFHPYLGCMILLPYSLIYISYGIKQICTWLSCLGDASYEMYLWGFVIQQLIVLCFGGSMGIGMHIMIAVPCVIMAGCLTHLFFTFRKGALQ